MLIHIINHLSSFLNIFSDCLEGKKYQKFFEKLEKKQKFKNKKSALNAFRGVPGARALFNDEGELDLTVEDIK